MVLTPRRTFAAVRPTTKTRVDLGLRIDGARPARGRRRFRWSIALQPAPARHVDHAGPWRWMSDISGYILQQRDRR